MSDLVLLCINMYGLEYSNLDFISYEYALVPMILVDALKKFINDYADQEVTFFDDGDYCNKLYNFELTIINPDSIINIMKEPSSVCYHNNEETINKYKILGYEKFNSNKLDESIFDILLYRLAYLANLNMSYGELKITDHDKILYCIKRLSSDPYQTTIEELKKMLNSNDYSSFKESLDKVASLLNEL